jgi:hypothetical protein
MNTKTLSCLLAVAVATAPASAAVLFSLPGPQAVSGGADPSIVNTGNDVGDWITTGGYDAGTGTVPLYFSFTMRITDNAGEVGTGGGFYTALQLFDGGERLAVGNPWFTSTWGGFFGPSDYNLTGDPAYVTGTAVNFVMKLDQVASSATIWMNPNLTATEASQAAGITTVRSGLGVNDEFVSINIRAGGGSGATTFSNIFIENTSPFAAVPEPGGLALSCLAGLAFLRRRR